MRIRRIAAALLSVAAIFASSQYAYAAAPSVSTSPTFSLDFSDSSKLSGQSWTDQVAGISATKVGTQFSPELGGIETFTSSVSYLDYDKPTIGAANNPAGDMSGEVWIKFTAFNANWNIMMTKWFNDLAGSGTPSDYHFAVYTDGVSPRQLNLHTTNKPDLRGTTTILLNRWYHFVFTIDNTSTTKRIALYVNNNLEVTYTSALAVRTANTSNKFIVGDARSATGPNAVIAKVRLYNKALTAGEVASNYQADLGFFSSTINLSLAATDGIYRKAQTLTATTTKAGRASFYANGKVIPGCLNKVVASAITCLWSPSFRGRVIVKVQVTPNDAAIPTTTAQSAVFVTNRKILRQ